jgi:large subunit ribosomal protein L17
MRHGDKVNNLGRKAAHRHALMMNLANSLIQHKRIFTTLAKAKALRGFVEPLITRAKEDNTHNRRIAFSYLKNKEAIKELFGNIAVKIGDRPGGYTRIIKTGFRSGDAAEMALIELVDFNEIYTQNKSTEKTTQPKKRTRRGPSKKKTENTDSNE